MEQELCKKMSEMYLVSQSAGRLMEAIASENTDFERVAAIVESDPALTASVLSVVNSAGMGLKQPVKTLSRAVSYLGVRGVVTIALEQSLHGLFRKPLKAYEIEAGILWEQSLLTAIAARLLAPLAITKINPDIAYTAGLLHDIGKTVFSEHTQKPAAFILEKMEQGICEDFLEAEYQATGTNHCEMGALLASCWQLPEDFIQVIRYHHRPGEASENYRSLVYVVHIACLISSMVSSGSGTDAFRFRLEQDYSSFVNLDETTPEIIVSKTTDEFLKIKERG